MTQFQPGESGNPNGRPKGIKDRRTVFRELVEPHGNALVKKSINLALEGNEQMLRLLLDRLLPAKPKDDPIPDIGDLNGTLTDQAKRLIKLVSEGTLTPSEANQLLKALNQEASLIDFDDFNRRLTALEERNKLQST